MRPAIRPSACLFVCHSPSLLLTPSIYLSIQQFIIYICPAIYCIHPSFSTLIHTYKYPYDYFVRPFIYPLFHPLIHLSMLPSIHQFKMSDSSHFQQLDQRVSKWVKGERTETVVMLQIFGGLTGTVGHKNRFFRSAQLSLSFSSWLFVHLSPSLFSLLITMLPIAMPLQCYISAALQ